MSYIISSDRRSFGMCIAQLLFTIGRLSEGVSNNNQILGWSKWNIVHFELLAEKEVMEPQSQRIVYLLVRYLRQSRRLEKLRSPSKGLTKQNQATRFTVTTPQIMASSFGLKKETQLQIFAQNDSVCLSPHHTHWHPLGLMLELSSKSILPEMSNSGSPPAEPGVYPWLLEQPRLGPTICF